MVSHNPAKSDGHRHCGSRDMMFFVVEGQDSTIPRLDPLLLFISRAHGMLCSHTHTKLQDVGACSTGNFLPPIFSPSFESLD